MLIYIVVVGSNVEMVCDIEHKSAICAEFTPILSRLLLTFVRYVLSVLRTRFRIQFITIAYNFIDLIIGSLFVCFAYLDVKY